MPEFPYYCRALRGATLVGANEPEDILGRTRRLLAVMAHVNQIDSQDIAAAFFTATDDLNAVFPAAAARQIGWTDVPVMCAREIDVSGAPRRCVRVMLLWNTKKQQRDLVNVYLEGAGDLRPDEPALPSVDWEAIDRWIEERRCEYENNMGTKQRT